MAKKIPTTLVKGKPKLMDPEDTIPLENLGILFGTTKIVVSDIPPTNPIVGDIWIKILT